MKSCWIALVVFAVSLLALPASAEAGCRIKSVRVKPRIFKRSCCRVAVTCKPVVECEPVSIDYPTPVRNWLFGIERKCESSCDSCK